jgi:pimeloyl-ACP methyl ester carboxylesterase
MKPMRYVITGEQHLVHETSAGAQGTLLRQNQRMVRTNRKLVYLVVLLASLSASCATVPRSEVVSVEESKDCVVLLHGLNRSWRAMRPMAESLQLAGFTTANVDYPSQSGPVEEIAPLAVGTGLMECRALGAERIHFVTHSIGGILLRYENEREPIADLGRVVMLGPPNQGSEVVDIAQDWPGMSLFGGSAGLQLGTDENSIPSQLGPVDFELGVIAGTGSINPWMSAMLPAADDGKVTVAATQVDGMDDFLVVGKSHRYITRSDIIFRNTESFLRTGRFLDTDKNASQACGSLSDGSAQPSATCF